MVKVYLNGELVDADARQLAQIEQAALNKTPAQYPLKRWQFQAMVEYLGKGAAIETAINAIPDAMQRAIAIARYKDSDVYERDDPLFDELAPVVGLTDAEIDAAWMQIALA